MSRLMKGLRWYYAFEGTLCDVFKCALDSIPVCASSSVGSSYLDAALLGLAAPAPFSVASSAFASAAAVLHGPRRRWALTLQLLSTFDIPYF